MPYEAPGYKEILAATLTDYKNQFPGADTSQGSDIYVKAAMLASAVWGLYQKAAWTYKQIFPHTAGSVELELHASTYGINRKSASRAAGRITFTGQNGTTVPLGAVAVTAGGIAYETTVSGDVAAGTLTLDAVAVEPGLTGNADVGASLTVQDPPPGLNVGAAVADDGNGFTAGTDLESDASLLERLLDRIQYPPAGGNAHDYKRWAMEIAGIVDAFVYPLRQGMSSVTVVVLTSGLGLERIPAQSLVDEVQAYIDNLRPVTDQYFQALAPTSLPTDVTVEIEAEAGYSFDTVKVWVENAIEGLLGRQDPLEVLRLSSIQVAVGEVEGVADFNVTDPVGNVTPQDLGGATVQMVSPGIITVTEIGV